MGERKRRTLLAPDVNLSLDQSEGSLRSDDLLDTPDDLDINVDDMETPDETDSLEFINSGNDLEWEGQTSQLWGFFFTVFLVTNGRPTWSCGPRGHLIHPAGSVCAQMTLPWPQPSVSRAKAKKKRGTRPVVCGGR